MYRLSGDEACEKAMPAFAVMSCNCGIERLAHFGELKPCGGGGGVGWPIPCAWARLMENIRKMDKSPSFHGEPANMAAFYQRLHGVTIAFAAYCRFRSCPEGQKCGLIAHGQPAPLHSSFGVISRAPWLARCRPLPLSAQPDPDLQIQGKLLQESRIEQGRSIKEMPSNRCYEHE